MVSYKHWINKNYDRLVSEYEDYFDSIDKNFEIPLSFEDYCFDKEVQAIFKACEWILNNKETK